MDSALRKHLPRGLSLARLLSRKYPSNRATGALT